MFYFISEDLIREKQTILYCLTTTVRAAVQIKRYFQNKKGRLTEVEEEDIYKRLFFYGDIS